MGLYFGVFLAEDFKAELPIFETILGLYFWVLLKVFGVTSVWCKRLLVRLPV